ncbi:hypothetical protein CNYM01_06894 [Colletotrichum nymphaeae SA-01]|uniref:Uncharacterized protein n=1 Tax=Colletotrichum nymphaeae SA-01 TaxID=1460502 RepID=A0A135RUY1_9PEZI|nr:hypothetical protein CNYM01_06894 [Colletotrichum nymphaeae SA-01]
MKCTYILPLIAATLVASSVLPSRDLIPPAERQAKKCQTFQIFRDQDAITGGSPSFVGTPQCCCQNAQCHVIDRVNGINTSANLNEFLAGTFTIEDARGQDKGTPGSNDIRGATYTVGAQGGCSQLPMTIREMKRVIFSE